MTNRFGVVLHPEDVRWAAAENVSEDIIAAVLLLHETSVDEIVPRLSAPELEQVIKLVGRSPRLYPPGILDALNQRRSPSSPSRLGAGADAPNSASERGHGIPPVAPHSTVERRNGAGTRQNAGHLAGEKDAKTGTRIGIAETARRRLIVEDLMKSGLSVRMISDVTEIPRSSVHRATRAVARAEARKQVAIAEITAELR